MKALVTALVAALALYSASARAEIESPLVKQGLQAYAELDYARAISLLQQAQKESLTRDEKLATWQTLGLAHASLGQTAEARADFQRVLRIDPAFQLDRAVAPKLRALFEEAKAQVATGGRVDASLPTVHPEVAPERPRAGQAVTVRVAYSGGVAQRVALYHRVAGQASYSRVLAEGAGGRFEVIVPGVAVRAPGIELHLELLDESGAAIASGGTLAQPLVFAVAGPSPRPIYKRGWFWGVVGGVAAAGALATALALTLPRSSTAAVTVNPQ